MASEDLENLLKLFDYALSSDNPAVKKALKNLLLVVSIVEPQEDAAKPGPLAEIKRELQLLRAEIAVLKNNTPLRGGTYTHPPSYPSYPPYPYQPNTSGGIPWSAGKNWTSTSSSTGATGATGSIDTLTLYDTAIGSNIDSTIESSILKYISSMIDNDDKRFNNKDIT